MATEFPPGWATMEIEAKWDTTEPTFDSIVAAFPDGGSKYGYDLNVRWGGTPRRYTDAYYDDPAAQLFTGLHAFRHRQRHQTASAIDITDTFTNLESAGWTGPDWEKVQYKSTPTRLAAVWFREEQGDAELTPQQVTDTLAGNPPTPPYTADDNPVALLLLDHPGFDFTQIGEVLNVVQYRHRVEFLDPVGGAPLYELSLDKVVTTAGASPAVESYAVELEALRNGAHTESSIDQLLALMLLLEDEFALTRATTSKGGLVVPDTAEPEMRLEATSLDYGDVELGFGFTKAIVIYNDGFAPLNVTVTNQSAGDPDASQWEISEHPTPVVVDVGSVPLTVEQVFVPDAEGSYSIEFLVAGDDSAYPEQAVTLLGTGTLPTPIDSVLVLDRSGSMADPAGERRKIDAMRDAADLYAHLLRAELGGGTGDQIGLVKYNDTNSVYLGLDAVDDPATTGSHMADLEDKLSDAALADAARLLPTGGTGIGGALQTGAALFPLPAGDRRHVMIVLTDGKENVEPWIADVLGPIQSADPDLATYSVGVGDDVEEDKLQDITNAGNGYHQVVGDLSGLAVFDLEAFYFKIFASAAGLDLVVDPTVMAPIGGQQPLVVHRARITSSDRAATFVALDSPALRRLYELELVAPNGQVIGAGVIAGGTTVQHLQRHTFTLYKVILPDPAANSALLGDWVLRLAPRRPGDDRRARDEQSEAQAGKALAPIGFAVAVASDYRLVVQATATSYTPGSRVELRAAITDRGRPATGARVRVDVAGPDGGVGRTVDLRPAGAGIWTGEFTLTATPGSYRFLFRSRGRNDAGEAVPREASRTVTLMPPRPRPPVRPPTCWPWPWKVALLLALVVPWIVLLAYHLAS